MSLGGSIRGRRGLPKLRAEAESRMTTIVHIERILGVTPDPMTGQDIVAVETVQAEQRCRVKAGTAALQPRDVSGVDIPERPDQLHFPWATTGLDVGLRATVLASLNPILVGKVYRLVRPHVGDDITAQRWGVESW